MKSHTKVFRQDTKDGRMIDKIVQIVQKKKKKVLLIISVDNEGNCVPLVFAGTIPPKTTFVYRNRLQERKTKNILKWIYHHEDEFSDQLDEGTPCTPVFCKSLKKAEKFIRKNPDIVREISKPDDSELNIVWFGIVKLSMTNKIKCDIPVFQNTEEDIDKGEEKPEESALGRNLMHPADEEMAHPFRNKEPDPDKKTETSIPKPVDDIDEITRGLMDQLSMSSVKPEPTDQSDLIYHPDTFEHVYDNGETLTGDIGLSTILCNIASAFGLVQKTSLPLMAPGHRAVINKDKVAIRNKTIIQFRRGDMINFVHRIGGTMSPNFLLDSMTSSPKERVSMVAPGEQSEDDAEIVLTAMFQMNPDIIDNIGVLTSETDIDNLRNSEKLTGLIQKFDTDDSWRLLITKKSVEHALNEMKKALHAGRSNKLNIKSIIGRFNSMVVLPEIPDVPFISINMKAIEDFVVYHAYEWVQFTETRKLINLFNQYVEEYEKEEAEGDKEPEE